MRLMLHIGYASGYQAVKKLEQQRRACKKFRWGNESTTCVSNSEAQVGKERLVEKHT